MRYSRSGYDNNKKEGSSKGIGLIIVILIGGVLIYFAGAGVLGSFISENIVTPVMTLITGESPVESKTTDTSKKSEAVESSSAEPSASASESAGTETQKIEVAAKSVYLLQEGVYSDESNAKSAAEAIKKRGGAGYILKDDKYRVFLSAYQTEDEATSVKKRLASEEDMETSIHELKRDPVSFNVTADKDTVKVISDAFSQCDDVMASLYDVTLKYDKQQITSDDVVTEISKIENDIKDTVANLKDVLGQEDNNVVQQLYDYYSNFNDSLKNIQEETGSEVEISSDLKYTYIELFNKQTEIIKTING